MNIIKGTTYTSDNSNIAVEILKIQYKSKDYTKVKAKIFNKDNGIVYESRTSYKLIHSQIQHWKIQNS